MEAYLGGCETVKTNERIVSATQLMKVVKAAAENDEFKINFVCVEYMHKHIEELPVQFQQEGKKNKLIIPYQITIIYEDQSINQIKYSEYDETFKFIPKVNISIQTNLKNQFGILVIKNVTKMFQTHEYFVTEFKNVLDKKAIDLRAGLFSESGFVEREKDESADSLNNVLDNLDKQYAEVSKTLPAKK